MKYNSNHISTENQDVTMGKVYDYIEDNINLLVEVLEDRSNKDRIEFKLLTLMSNDDYFLVGKTFEVSALLGVDAVYSGMWRLKEAYL